MQSLMIACELSLARALASVALLALAGATAGCDPSQDPPVWDDGPPFLIMAPAVTQPESPDQGTIVFVQARGGNHVAIQTLEGTHRYGTLNGYVHRSCAEISASRPLYLMVRPDSAETIIEARLYNMCDSIDNVCATVDSSDPEAAFMTCETQGALVTTDNMPIRRVDNQAPVATPAADGAVAVGESGSQILLVIKPPSGADGSANTTDAAPQDAKAESGQ